MATNSQLGSLSHAASHGPIDAPPATIPGAHTPGESSTPDAAVALRAPVGPVLLAVGGTLECEPAVRLALDLAERHGASVAVVSVVDTRPQMIPPPLDLALALADAGPARTEQEDDVRASISTTLRRPVDWPIEVALGKPSDAIVAAATTIGASLIVLGLRRHHALDRALHDETTLDVMRAAPCPVLGVTFSLFGLPRRVLVGVDFSRASLGAARAALTLVADGGVLVLAYVEPPGTPNVPDDGERVVHDLGVGAAFEWFDAELGRVSGATLEHVVLGHEPGRTVFDLLVGHAAHTSVDAIALGSARHGRIERWLLGSVATDAARDGRYPLLVVPPGVPSSLVPTP